MLFIHSASTKYFPASCYLLLSWVDITLHSISIASLIVLCQFTKNGAQINLFWNYDVFIFMEKTTKIYLLLHCYVYSIKIFLSLLGFLSFCTVQVCGWQFEVRNCICLVIDFSYINYFSFSLYWYVQVTTYQKLFPM